MKLKHGMILAAGLGTRMRPLTETLPKPLIPVGGKPLIDWCLDLVVEAGLTEIVVNTSYRAAQLETYLAARTTPRITISREEPVPLETGGGIVKALPFLGEEPFFTMNSDAVFPATEQYGSPVAQLASHWSDEIDFLMLLIPKRHAIGRFKKKLLACFINRYRQNFRFQSSSFALCTLFFAHVPTYFNLLTPRLGFKKSFFKFGHEP